MLRGECDNNYRVFDFFLCPPQELLDCHPESQMMVTMKVMTAMMTMTMMMIMVTMTMMENAHIRKGSSLITFTLATPATVTGTPWMMVDEDDDVDDDGDDHDGDINDDVDDDADDVDNDGDDDDDDPCIPAVTGSP